ncbi:MAG: isoprenylcysteine carboxylmethyltransferase family protein [Lysobacteraceae bacterium]|nr:MAG: isoprenylcysteine carboxylmethyltransferase family protein [Xanthomonadaceae bacterium]
MSGRPTPLETKIPPPLVMLGVAALMWMCSRQWPWFVIGTSWRFPLALAIAVAALILGAMSVLPLRRARTVLSPMRPQDSSALITSGPYRYSRNPMYVGLALLLLAWAVWLGHWPAGSLLLLFVAYVDRFQIRAEERALSARFGAEYAAYRMRVRRWL